LWKKKGKNMKILYISYTFALFLSLAFQCTHETEIKMQDHFSVWKLKIKTAYHKI